MADKVQLLLSDIGTYLADASAIVLVFLAILFIAGVVLTWLAIARWGTNRYGAILVAAVISLGGMACVGFLLFPATPFLGIALLSFLLPCAIVLMVASFIGAP